MFLNFKRRSNESHPFQVLPKRVAVNTVCLHSLYKRIVHTSFLIIVWLDHIEKINEWLELGRTQIYKHCAWRDFSIEAEGKSRHVCFEIASRTIKHYFEYLFGC